MIDAREPGSVLRVALGSENPRLVAAILAWFEEDDAELGQFRVLGQPCSVVQLCGSIRELRSAAASETIDLLVVSSVLNAIPFEELRELARTLSGRVVVLAQDRAALRWTSFPAPVLDAEPARGALAQAMTQALTEHRDSEAVPASPAEPSTAPVPGGSVQGPGVSRGRLIAVTTAAAPDGASTLACALAFAAGVVARTALFDANPRGSVQEFHVGADPTRNACLLAQRQPKTATEWAAALRAEMQPMGAPSRAELLCGVTRPSLRAQLTPAFLRTLLDALRGRYQLTFVDTSGAGWAADDPPIDRLVLSMADQVLLVVRPDEQGIARARRALREWSHSNQLEVVLNLAGLPGTERAAEVEQELGVRVAAVVPADVRRVAAARARHRPFVVQPGCRASKPVLDLAQRLVGGEPLALPADVLDRGEHWWNRLPVPLARRPQASRSS